MNNFRKKLRNMKGNGLGGAAASSTGTGDLQAGGQGPHGQNGALGLNEKVNVRKVHYILHNLDTMISKIEARGLSAPANAKEFKQLLKLAYDVRQYNLKEIR